MFLYVIVTESNRQWQLCFVFLEKKTSFTCLLRSGLNCIFHLKTKVLFFSKTKFNYFADISILSTFEKSEVFLCYSTRKIIYEKQQKKRS